MNISGVSYNGTMQNTEQKSIQSLQNDFNIKGIANMLGHSKEIISADVYGDTAEIIEDCLYATLPFMKEVMPECREDKYYDYSDIEEIESLADEYLQAA